MAVSDMAMAILVAGGSPHYKTFEQRLKEMTPDRRRVALRVDKECREAKYVPQDWTKFKGRNQ